MNFIFSILLAIVGISMIAWRDNLAFTNYKWTNPGNFRWFGLKNRFEDIPAWESKWVRRLYVGSMVFGGIVLLVMAYAISFGPVQF